MNTLFNVLQCKVITKNKTHSNFKLYHTVMTIDCVMVNKVLL